MDSPADDDAVVADGEAARIEYAVLRNGHMPAKDFIEGLETRQRVRLAVLFQKLVDTGKIHNRTQFKKLQGEIWEFKRDQIRVLCFRVQRCWFLTHGLMKKSDTLRPEELERADRIRQEHLNRKGG